MKLPSDKYKKWSDIRRAFNVNLASRVDYIELQFKPELAKEITGKFQEFADKDRYDDVTEQEVSDFIHEEEDLHVRRHLDIHMRAALKRVSRP